MDGSRKAEILGDFDLIVRAMRKQLEQGLGSKKEFGIMSRDNQTDRLNFLLLFTIDDRARLLEHVLQLKRDRLVAQTESLCAETPVRRETENPDA